MRNGRILMCAALAAAILGAQAASAASPFAAAMNKVCSAANRKVAGIGVSQSLYQLAVNEPRILAASEWKLARLGKLAKAPAALAVPFRRYLTLQRTIETLESQLVSAAKAAHLSTVEQLQQQVVVVQKTQDGAVRKLGAADCLSTAS